MLHSTLKPSFLWVSWLFGVFYAWTFKRTWKVDGNSNFNFSVTKTYSFSKNILAIPKSHFFGMPRRDPVTKHAEIEVQKKRKNVKHGRNTCAHLVYKSRKRYKYVGSESVGRMSSHILVQTSYTQYWIRSRDDRNCAKIGLKFRTFVELHSSL